MTPFGRRPRSSLRHNPHTRVPYMSRRLSALALAGLVAVSSIAATALADFSGGWDVLVQGPQGPVNSVLTIEQKGDSVTGKFESELGVAPISGQTKGDSIKFAFALDAGGQMLNLLAVGALKDKDNLAGNIVAEGMGEFPFEAKRK